MIRSVVGDTTSRTVDEVDLAQRPPTRKASWADHSSTSFFNRDARCVQGVVEQMRRVPDTRAAPGTLERD